MNTREGDSICVPKPRKKVVGKYELGKLLGEGAWGKVRLGIHQVTKKKVAIKIIEKDIIRKQNMSLQIKREVSIMKQMRDKNPHVVTLHEVLASKTKIYLVLELVSGGELFHKLVQEERFTEPKARYYFRQLVKGVELCHKLKICHRDLKPENLLIDDTNKKEPKLKISDFGLSALYASNSSQDDGGHGAFMSSRIDLLHTTCGTPNYVSPEVLKDDGYDGRKADIWSMGIILFVMVTGTLPFDEPSLTKLFDKIDRADYRNPPYLSRSVVDLISKILEPVPAKRICMAEIRSHPWYGDEDSDNDGLGTNCLSHSDNSSCNNLSFVSVLESNQIISIMLIALRDLSFAANVVEGCKIKGHKTSRRGVIGITIVVSKLDSKTCSIGINKGRGDIFEYSRELKNVLAKINQII